MSDEDILKNLSKAEKSALRKGGGRYGSNLQGFRALKARGLAIAVPAHGRVVRGVHVGQWKWSLTRNGHRLRLLLGN